VKALALSETRVMFSFVCLASIVPKYIHNYKCILNLKIVHGENLINNDIKLNTIFGGKIKETEVEI
jgi:hypothetical protein